MPATPNLLTLSQHRPEEGLEKLRDFKHEWQKYSLERGSSCHEQVASCVMQLYKSCSELPPTIVWCDSPWQMTVLPLTLNLLLSCSTHEELVSHLRSRLSQELTSQSLGLWKHLWQRLHPVLAIVLQDRLVSDIGQDLNDRFGEKRKKDLQNLDREQVKLLSKSFCEGVNNQLSELWLPEINVEKVAKSTIVKLLSSSTASELTGQFEYSVREKAQLFFKRNYLDHEYERCNPAPSLHLDVPFSALRADGRAQADHNYLVHRSLTNIFNKVHWGEWCTDRLFLCAYLRHLEPEHKWSKKRLKELQIWSTLAQETNACLFFQNFCFVSERPRKPANAGQSNLAGPARCDFADNFSFTYTQLGNSAVSPVDILSQPEHSRALATETKSASGKAVGASDEIPKPVEIKKWLDQKVIGQDEAKKVLAVAVYQHYNRIKKLSGTRIKNATSAKSNILLIGPTGCGKTMLAQSLAALLSVPIAIFDATSLSQRGYVGGKVEDMVKSLYYAAENNVTAARTGIIFIDEIDKLRAARDGHLDVAGEGVQQNLLKMIEGKIVSFEDSNGKKISIDTTNILFIASGAFSQIEKIIQERIHSKRGSNIGLGAKTVSSADKLNAFNNLLKEVSSEDLVKFGMIPELIGRLPAIAVLEELDVDSLTAVITHSTDSLFNQYSDMLKIQGVRFDLPPEAARRIAEEAHHRRTGARGLRAVFEKLMLNLMFELPSRSNVDHVVMDFATVDEALNKLRANAN